MCNVLVCGECMNVWNTEFVFSDHQLIVNVVVSSDLLNLIYYQTNSNNGLLLLENISE